ncbi:hypothetical protein RhiJN_21187 [Ceratobasidium sp. AG-Ba]|nr:hypothetical protein RhiJN_21187 [Ceratobasidium sp. AG-Ba]
MRLQTLDIIGSFVDHDDKIEDNKLLEAYDHTAQYWEVGSLGYGQPKTTHTTAKLTSILRGKTKAPEDFSNPRPLLLSTHDYEAQPTHPSEHNAVLVVGQQLSESRRAKRIQEHNKWEKHMRADVAKGRVPSDGWEAMITQRSEGHEQGFMRSFPDPDLMPVVPFGAETCAAHDGGVLDGSTLTTAPTDGKYSAGVCAAGMGHFGSECRGYAADLVSQLEDMCPGASNAEKY